MQNFSWKTVVINYVVPILLFIGIAYTYFSPVLEGKVLLPNDTKVYLGQSKEITDTYNETGEKPLWTNSMFGGMPAYQISIQYTGNKLNWLRKFFLTGARPASYLVLWFLSAFMFLLVLGIHPWVAFAGALAFGFSSNFYMLVGAGHMTKVYALGYAGFVLSGVLLAFKKKMWIGAAITGTALGLMLNANHPQMTYYTGLMVVVLGIVYLVYAVREKALVPFFKTVSVLVLAVLLAVGANYARTVTNAEYLKYSQRGKSELTQGSQEEHDASGGMSKSYIWAYSYGIGESFTLMIPNFNGGGSQGLGKDSETYKVLKKNGVKNADQIFQGIRGYWGQQGYTAAPTYFGAIICFLFLFGAILVKSREKWWLVSITVLGIMLSWGKNMPWLAGFFIDFVPVFNKFRDMSMLMVIPMISAPALAMMALNDVVKGKSEKKTTQKALYYAAGITGGLSILFVLSPGLAGDFIGASLLGQPASELPAWLTEAVIADRKELLVGDAFRSFAFIALSAVAIYMFLQDKLKQNALIAIIAVLVLGDMWPVDKRYLDNDAFVPKRVQRNPYKPSKADAFILKDKSEHRVLNLTVSTFNDASTSYFHHSIGGYHSVKVLRYNELILRKLHGELQTAIQRLQKKELSGGICANLNALNMLNTKYIITNPNGVPYTNRLALGNAWLVDKVNLVENADAELAGLSSFDPAKEVLVDKRFEDQLKGFVPNASAKGAIKLSEYTPDHLTYSYQSDSEKIAVFSEVYFEKGWKAFIDDKEVDHFRANYVLRGLKVPAGSHKIEFKFRPASYYAGNNISLASSLILMLALFGLIVIEIKKKLK